MLAKYLLSGLSTSGRRWIYLGAVGLDHRAPIRLLLIAGVHHVHGALEPEQSARECERASPLPRARLGGQTADALDLVVVGLRDGGGRLVAPRRATGLVLG